MQARAAVAYLDAMGITVWRRREAAGSGAAVAPATMGLECVQHARAPVARVVVEWPGPFLLEPGHPAGGLLLKILAALKQPLERFAIYRVDQNAAGESPLADLPASAGPVLLLAEGVRAVPDVVPLPTLERMLADPVAKRTAWARLRPLIPRLGAGAGGGAR